MFKRELVKYIARKVPGCTRKQVKNVLDTFSKYILYSVQNNPDETIPVPGVGRFERWTVPEKRGISNLTGERWTVPEHDELRFTFIERVRMLEDIDNIVWLTDMVPEVEEPEEEVKEEIEPQMKYVKPDKPLDQMSTSELIEYINSMKYTELDEEDY